MCVISNLSIEESSNKLFNKLIVLFNFNKYITRL